MALATCGTPFDNWDPYAMIPPPPPPIIPVVVVQEAEASEPTATAVQVAEATEPVVAEETREVVDTVGLLDVTIAPKETCPAPVVYGVHLEQVRVADENLMHWLRM